MTVPQTPSATPVRPALPGTLTRRERFLIELSRAIEEAAYPSELLNRLQAAVTLSQHALGQVQALFHAAPTLYQVVRAQVHQALGLDPDHLFWTSALLPEAPVTLTLTQVAVERCAVVTEFIRRDARWHEHDISFGSLAPELALRIRKEKIELHEHSILQLLKPGLVDQETPQCDEFLARQQALNTEREVSLACLKASCKCYNSN